MSDWPLAAEGVGLHSHLSRVAGLSLCLFGRELKALAKRWQDVEMAMWLSGYFHDLGKASRYYRERWEKVGRLSFPYHEYLSATVLMELSNTKDERLACIYRIAAKVVTRHHSAMVGRHPSLISEMVKGYPSLTRGNMAEIIRNALEKLEIEDVKEALKIGEHNTDVVMQDVGQRVGNVVDKVRKVDAGGIAHVIREVANLEERVEACGGLNEFLVVRALTGFLIVADNIVAGVEGRSPEDQPVPLYTRSWVRELGPRLESCRDYVPDADRLRG